MSPSQWQAAHSSGNQQLPDTPPTLPITWWEQIHNSGR